MAANGYDGWDQTVWAVDEEGKRHEDRLNVCGVGIPKIKMDEFVMMRLAEMIKGGLIEDAIDRTIDGNSGNFGCDALTQSAESLKTLLQQVIFHQSVRPAE